MKPDWQNKSFAKTSSPTGPSTTHPKLKVGMTNLHSKIAVANHNMPQAPKPAVRKFADGGTVLKTRSDEEIGDTDTKSGKVDPGSFDRRAAEGVKNMERLRAVGDSITSFFSKEDKASSDSITSNKGGNEPNDAKPVERFAATKSAEPEAKAEVKGESVRKWSDYMAKAPESAGANYGNEGNRTSMGVAPETSVATPVKQVKQRKEAQPASKPAAKPAVQTVVEAKPSPVAEEKSVQKPAPAERPEKKPLQLQKLTFKDDILNQAPTINRSSSTVGQSQADIEQLIRQRQGADSKTDTGDETKRLRDRTSTFVPGFGQIDKEGNIIPNVRGGRMASQVYSGDGSTAMSRAEKKYLQSRIDAGNLTAMEKAQAKRAGLI